MSKQTPTPPSEVSVPNMAAPPVSPEGGLPPTKTCTKCGKEKSTAEFYHYPSRKEGLYPQCKRCVRDQHRRWYTAKWPNGKPPRKSGPYKDYSGMEIGRLTVLRYDKSVRQPSGKSRTMYWCRCECGKEKSISANSLSNAIKSGGAPAPGASVSCGCLTAQRARERALPASEARVRRGFNKLKDWAKRSGKSVEIALDDWRTLTARPCVFCGDNGTSTMNTRRGRFNYTGVDRIDSDKGYILGNVQPCCWTCNRAKSNMSQDDFLAWVSRLIAHNTKG